MKHVKTYSIIAILVTAGIIIFAYKINTKPDSDKAINIEPLNIHLDTLNNNVQQMRSLTEKISIDNISIRENSYRLRDLALNKNKTNKPKVNKFNPNKLRINGLTINDFNDRLYNSIQDVNSSIQSANDTIRAINDSIQSVNENIQSVKKKAESLQSNGLAMQIFWVKVAFSFIFCIAALYVVLSNKYDDGTKKKAFDVLGLIVAVWIGTIS